MTFEKIFSVCFLLTILPALYAWQNEPNCGIKGPSDDHPFDRIINGHNAAQFEFPWQISVQIAKVQHFCTASIINRRWILSAAHCFYDSSRNATRDKNYFKLVAGVFNMSKQSEPSRIELGIEKIFVNLKYNPETTQADYDISIIKLDSDLPLDDPSKHIGAVCLPEPHQDLDRLKGKTATNLGWGTVSKTENGEVVDHNEYNVELLQKVNLTIWKQQDCVNAYFKNVGELPFQPVTERNICANRYQNSPCHGDSGGPLVVYEQNRWYQYGITSWGDLICGYPYHPAVFSRVTEYIDWIDRIVKAN